jgi:hypothetical protein
MGIYTSDDIDIALDDIEGEEFGTFVNSYLSEIGEETHTIGVIQVTKSLTGNMTKN